LTEVKTVPQWFFNTVGCRQQGHLDFWLFYCISIICNYCIFVDENAQYKHALILHIGFSVLYVLCHSDSVTVIVHILWMFVCISCGETRCCYCWYNRNSTVKYVAQTCCCIFALLYTTGVTSPYHMKTSSHKFVEFSPTVAQRLSFLRSTFVP